MNYTSLALDKLATKFYNPYPEAIDKENPYPRGYRIPEFSIFSGEDGLPTLEHVAKFIVQCGELANYEISPISNSSYFPTH